MSQVTMIDVSDWQKEIAWHDVAAHGIKHAYIKASEGVDYVDPFFERNAQEAKAVGIQRGFYHFAHPEHNHPQEEVAHFLETINKVGFGELPLQLDLERASTGDTSAWVTEFLNELHTRTGHEVVLYTYTGFIEEHLNDTLAHFPLWIADYGVTEPNTVHWKDWTAWQYTDAGTVPGIEGKVDLSHLKIVDTSTVSPTQKPTAKVPSGTPWLGEKFTRQGPDVRLLQEDLNAIHKKIGYKPITVDGVFGPETAGAVIALRRHAGLELSGVYVPKVAEKLKEVLG